jgi:hypothetical protein
MQYLVLLLIIVTVVTLCHDVCHAGLGRTSLARSHPGL